MKTKIIFILFLVVGLFIAAGSNFTNNVSAAEVSVETSNIQFEDSIFKYEDSEVLYLGGFENTFKLLNLLELNCEKLDCIGETSFYGDYCYTLDLATFYGRLKNCKMTLVYSLDYKEFGVSIGELSDYDNTYIYDFSEEYLKILLLDGPYSLNYFVKEEYEGFKAELSELFWSSVYTEEPLKNGTLVKDVAVGNVYDYSCDENFYFGGYEGLTKLYDYCCENYVNEDIFTYFEDEDMYCANVGSYLGTSCYLRLYFRPLMDSFDDLDYISGMYFLLDDSAGPGIFSDVEMNFSTDKDYYNSDEFYEFVISNSSSNSDNYYFTLYDTEISNLFWECVYTELDNSLYSFEIEGLGSTYISNYDNPASFSDILYTVKCFDEDGTDLSSNITYKTAYPVNDNFYNLKLGDYPVSLSCADESGNIATFDFVIKVVDITAPYIAYPDDVYICSNLWKTSVETFTQSLDIMDNYDSFHDGFGKNNLELIENTYSGSGNLLNWQTPGDYKLVFKAVDSSGNETIFTLNITVVDGVAPCVKDSEGNVITVSSVTKEKNVFLTLSDVFSSLNIEDPEEGVLDSSSVSVVEDNYSGNGNKVGTYSVLVEIKDSAGNICNHEIIIDVLDSIPPVYIIGKDVIMVQNDSLLTQDDFVDILINLGYIDKLSGNSTVVLDTLQYENNYQTPGTYVVTAKICSVDGSENTVLLDVNVTAVDDSVIELEGASSFEKLINFIKVEIPNFFKVTLPNAWNSFLDFFRIQIPNTFKKFVDFLKFWD